MSTYLVLHLPRSAFLNSAEIYCRRRRGGGVKIRVKLVKIRLNSKCKTGGGQARRQRQGNQLDVKAGELGVVVADEDLLGQCSAIDPAI